ncbi:MAG: penicillin-binding protein 2 [Actinomycetota bacterium]|nr:penicillin-binding protein 2 [Actinomycetota bacterium]
MTRAMQGRDSTSLRLGILGVIVLSLFATMVARLWYLQVLAAPELRVEAQENSVRLIYTEANRGRILDRQGRVLVENRIVPTVVVERDIHRDVLARLAAELGKDVKEFQRRIEDVRFSQFKPVPVVEDVPKDKLVYLREHHDDFPGVSVVQLTQRSYPHGQLAAHVLGYVGEINDTELEERKGQSYRGGDTIGKSGVELAYESELRGEPQVEKLQVDAEGRVLRSLGKQPGIPGHDVQLTIDLDAQQVAEESLQQALETARKSWDPSQLKYFIAPAASAVVMDPRDGAILAMASFPTYNPADFGNGISTANFEFLQDPANHFPLNNRAIQGQYAPGSTFKPITALAALGRQVIAPTTTINDTGVYVVGDRPYRNAGSRPFGTVDLPRALSVSSDVYFYRLGEALDSDKKPFPMQDTARQFGFGKVTDIELPFELEGRIPDPDSRRRLHESNPEAFPFPDWFTGESVNLSVGQGDLVVTPLQLVNAYAALANGGTIWKPHVGGAINDVMRQSSVPVEPEQAGKVDIPAAARSAIIGGLERVVSDEEGTASGAFAGFPLDRFRVAGKTGTAEVEGKQDTALFVAFGPTDNPRYVAAVVMEESGFGAAAAAPAVRRIFDGLLNNPLQPVARVGGSD